MKRTACSACGSDQLDQFLDLGTSPIADAYTATPDEVSPTYPLQVAVCAKCRLVQLLEVLDGETLFGTGYSFYSSASPPLSAYHAAYAQDVLRRCHDLAERGVVEIGCNDGDMLRHFADYPAIGVDPAEGPASVAQGRGLEVLVRPFGLAVAHEIRDRRGRQGLIIANHVLAHVADVADVLAGVAALLAPNGVAMVEVQYLPDLLVNNAFDLVYHEHRNFFSLTSLSNAASQHGLSVVDAVLTDRQGGSLRVALRPDSRPVVLSGLLDTERWLNDFGAYAGMQGRAERIRSRLQDLVVGDVAVYGAPAKLTTLVAFCGFDIEHLHWCVDSTPAKQGRYVPGTHIEIYPPGEPDVPRDGFLLASWNYARQIMANNPGNRWIIPFPAPVIF